MSSALRMLLIAILAGGDDRKKRKGRKGGKPNGQGKKQGYRERERELKRSRVTPVYAPEMEQEIRTCEREVMGDKWIGDSLEKVCS